MVRHLLGALLICAACVATRLAAQEPDAAVKPPRADDYSDWISRGVLRVIPPEPEESEVSTGPIELYEIRKGIPGLEYAPNFEAKTQTVFEKAAEVTLRRPVWSLEFSFKPVRMITVDVPQPEGRMKKKLIWYLLYRVRNLGGHLQPVTVPAQDEELRTKLVEIQNNDEDKQRTEEEIKDFVLAEKKIVDELPKDMFPQIVFFPHFVLEAHEFDKEYLDRVIPSALGPIAKRERVGRPIYDSVTISRQKIEVTTAEKDNSVWGVATWEDVDPRIDYFSIYVQGLTNAFKITEKPDSFKPGDKPGTGRTFKRKTLELHFWRPGDTIDESDAEIQYGMPNEKDPALQQEINTKYGVEQRLDYRWLYR